MAVNESWLIQSQEAALEPDLPILDSHHHLWDHPPQRPDDSYVLSDYLADARSGHRIVGSVFIECNQAHLTEGPQHMRPVGETRWVNQVADDALAQGVAVAAAIVGTADFDRDAGQVDELLQAHQDAAPKRFRGIRQTHAWDADPKLRYRHLPTREGMLLDPGWRRGFACLRSRNLSFDAWGYHTQLSDVADLASAFPDVPIVVGHLGGPLGVGRYAAAPDEVDAHWWAGMTALATRPNVHVKLGGTAMHLNGYDWTSRARPPTSDDLVQATCDRYHRVIDLFSPERCMFESNFPVDKESVPAIVIWNAYKKLSARYGTSERAALFLGTASRVYRL